MVRELKYLRHSRLEAMYLHAALHYGLRGRRHIPPFSLFKDRLHYAGYTPSTKYLKSMFIAWFASHRLYIDRIMSSLSARVLRADHTFKTVDHQGRLPGGEPIHTALYEGVNENEEVRFYNLVLTQGFAPPKAHMSASKLSFLVMDTLQRRYFTPTIRVVSLIVCDFLRVLMRFQDERNWHERVTPSLKRNVEHVVFDPFRELPEFKARDPPQFASSSDRIDTVCDAILQLLPLDDSIYVALAVDADHDQVSAIQLRTKLATYIFDVTSFTTAIPISLKSILTHPRIIKFGHSIATVAKHLASAWRLDIPSSSLVDLGKLAKLKGAAADPNCSLATLCGAVLRLRLSEPALATPLLPVSRRLDTLSRDIECAWLVQDALMKLGSVGIPLQPSQLRASQPVAFVIGNKTQAWGELVEHNGSITVPGTEGSVAVTNAYSVIRLTKLFVPGFIVAKHGQTLEWLNGHGGLAVVQTRTLRAVRLNLPIRQLWLWTMPSLVFQRRSRYPQSQNNCSKTHQPIPSRLLPVSSLNLVPKTIRLPRNPVQTTLKNSSLTQSDMLRMFYANPNLPRRHASRVLDDAYHFMDRLLRLLSKKASGIQGVCTPLQRDHFLRAFDGSTPFGPKRVHSTTVFGRYIPCPEKLVRDLLVLFTCFQDLLDSDSKKFFSKDARKQAASLIETARLGFLSDPPGLALYYFRGRDKSGLALYRTIRGTNSVEGGVHKQIRRIFGSLHASLALTEAILGNWFHRRNRRIGHYNRAGARWSNHFDIWLLDEIVETAIKLDVKPTFPEPALLATRIATSETFGVIPITSELAHANEIPLLPSSNILTASHHNDTHWFALTQFSTTPVNLYRYLQLRQRTTAAVVPVHTRREFELFLGNVGAFIPLGANNSIEKTCKLTKYDEFARFWNRRVAMQSTAELDSTKRIYFKLPEQLERHHKKTLQWRSTRAVLNMGENVAALEPIHELLRDPARQAVVLPAVTHDAIEVDYTADPFVGTDISSFNPTAMRQQSATRRAIQAVIAAIPNREPSPVRLEDLPPPDPELHQAVLAFVPGEHDGDARPVYYSAHDIYGRKPADKILAGFKSVGRGIANFWATRAPQGAQAMTEEQLNVAISHRSALDISQMDMMKITFAGRSRLSPPPSQSLSNPSSPILASSSLGIPLQLWQNISLPWRLDIPSSSLVDLGKLAKLKGAAADPNCSLATLCGAVLRLRLSEPALATPLLPVSRRLDTLSRDIECAWLVQDALMKLGSVGIPLQPSQLRASQPVAFVIGNKTQAWGELVEHNGSITVPGTEGSVAVTNAYSDLLDSDSKKFFSKDARKQAASLIETARLGFLSDPPGLALYYFRGRDKSGLALYRTIRGTNSVEGGVHKQIRRIFGSLHASLALTEAILGNWFHRRNRRIGHYNRAGARWSNHFDIWLLDEIVETAIKLDVKPTFPEPALLATRIATSETFGVIPITSELAHANEIPLLPSSNILTASHHNDTHWFALTQFSTTPVNLYRYLQLRQRTTAAVVPVHTRREFELFLGNAGAFIPLGANNSIEKTCKLTKYDEFARFWNRRVAMQSTAELDSTKRIYFKLPEQLEPLEPIHELLRDPARQAVVLPAVTHDAIEVDYTADPFVGTDISSFNPTAMRQQSATRRAIQAVIAAIPNRGAIPGPARGPAAPQIQSCTKQFSQIMLPVVTSDVDGCGPGVDDATTGIVDASRERVDGGVKQKQRGDRLQKENRSLKKKQDKLQKDVKNGNRREERKEATNSKLKEENENLKEENQQLQEQLRRTTPYRGTTRCNADIQLSQHNPSLHRTRISPVSFRRSAADAATQKDLNAQQAKDLHAFRTSVDELQHELQRRAASSPKAPILKVKEGHAYAPWIRNFAPIDDLRLHRRTANRIAIEAFIKANVQVAHEMSLTEDITFSGDSTPRRNVNFQSHHARYCPPEKQADGTVKSAAKPKTRSPASVPTTDHSAATSRDTWITTLNAALNFYDSIPLSQRNATGGIQAEAL
ncbi:hypothetical protein HMN09_00604600 [Mycena chlorophos]|uniref:Uncharacterized protein n=1 Tax=Mycena chlorophos TaxID=658473 RepID=A0A8H6T2R5_MYCCL|nr:hypothetical protein HMN09_00604600 [Mycena chlorophos]